MLHRRHVVERLLADRPDDLLVVTGLGSPTWDVCAVADDARNFHFIGAMGQAVPFALGLALAQPRRRVLVITGDGDMLMGLGALATVANQAPRNLGIVVLDNEAYLETGGQATATAGVTDLEAVARGCGIAATLTARADAEVNALARLVTGPGPSFAVAKVHSESLPMAMPYSFDGVTAMNRFRAAVLD